MHINLSWKDVTAISVLSDQALHDQCSYHNVMISDNIMKLITHMKNNVELEVGVLALIGRLLRMLQQTDDLDWATCRLVNEAREG